MIDPKVVKYIFLSYASKSKGTDCGVLSISKLFKVGMQRLINL